MSRFSSPLDPDASSSATEISRLKRKLAVTNRELDEARVGSQKKIP